MAEKIVSRCSNVEALEKNSFITVNRELMSKDDVEDNKNDN